MDAKTNKHQNKQTTTKYNKPQNKQTNAKSNEQTNPQTNEHQNKQKSATNIYMYIFSDNFKKMYKKYNWCYYLIRIGTNWSK